MKNFVALDLKKLGNAIKKGNYQKQHLD